MTSCEQILDDLSAYVDGEADADARRAVERHVERCDGCTTTLRDVRADAERFRVAFQDMVADAPAAPSPPRSIATSTWIRRTVIVTAAASLFVGAVALWSGIATTPPSTKLHTALVPFLEAPAVEATMRHATPGRELAGRLLAATDGRFVWKGEGSTPDWNNGVTGGGDRQKHWVIDADVVVEVPIHGVLAKSESEAKRAAIWIARGGLRELVGGDVREEGGRLIVTPKRGTSSAWSRAVVPLVSAGESCLIELTLAGAPPVWVEIVGRANVSDDVFVPHRGITPEMRDQLRELGY